MITFYNSRILEEAEKQLIASITAGDTLMIDKIMGVIKYYKGEQDDFGILLKDIKEIRFSPQNFTVITDKTLSNKEILLFDSKGKTYKILNQE